MVHISVNNGDFWIDLNEVLFISEPVPIVNRYTVGEDGMYKPYEMIVGLIDQNIMLESTYEALITVKTKLKTSISKAWQ